MKIVLPGGMLIPCAAVAMIAWLLVSSSWIESRDVAILIVLGASMYAVGKRRARRV